MSTSVCEYNKILITQKQNFITFYMHTNAHTLNCSCYNRIFISLLLLSCCFHSFSTHIHYCSSKITANLEIERKCECFAMHKKGKQFSHITLHYTKCVLFYDFLQIFMMQRKYNFRKIHIEYLFTIRHVYVYCTCSFKVKKNINLQNSTMVSSLELHYYIFIIFA